jgi:hypothetical protein
MNSGVPSTLCGVVRPRHSVARPRSPILTTPLVPLTKILSHFRSLQSRKVRCGRAVCATRAFKKAGKAPKAASQALLSAHPAPAAAPAAPVDDGRVVRVQVHEALQDLPGPALEHLLVDALVLLAVPTGVGGGAGQQTGEGRRHWPAARPGQGERSGSPSSRAQPQQQQIAALRGPPGAGRPRPFPPAAAASRRGAAHCRSVPDVNSSVMKLTVRFFWSSQLS